MPRGGSREGSGKKPKWNHGKTKVIRVPEALADEVLEYARKLDEREKKQLQNENFELFNVSEVINLAGVSVTAINGQMAVLLTNLIKKGYQIKPDRLQQIVVNASKTKQSKT